VFVHPLSDHETRVIATDLDGKQLLPVLERTHADGQTNTLRAIFDVPPERVKRLEFSARALNEWVCFRNVTLDPARKTEVSILHGDDPTTQPGR